MGPLGEGLKDDQWKCLSYPLNIHMRSDERKIGNARDTKTVAGSFKHLAEGGLIGHNAQSPQVLPLFANF
jgi:hypothetical protein